MPSLFSTLMLLGAAASPATAAIAAWWDGIGPQIILQNETTGQIRYSKCGQRDVPLYSPDDGSVFSLDYTPKNGTPLAGTGYWTEILTVASIYYIDQRNQIANALFHCNMSTGKFESKGNWIVSKPAPSIHNNTGLAAVLLGATGGYRVYYHDKDFQLSEIGYTVDDNWQYRGVISKDINASPAIGAAFSGKVNITVATPRDSRHIAVTRYNNDTTWHRTTLPRALQGNLTNSETNRTNIAINETAPFNFTLTAWDGTAKSMGVSIDKEYTRSIFYIGNDNNLYQVANKNYYWSQRNQSTVFWPKADKPSADLAVAYEFNTNLVRAYYMVNGSLAEIKFENDNWKAWAPVATPPPQAVIAPPPPANSTETKEENTAMGLSAGAKAGIGVGVSLGVIAIGALIALFFLVRRRKDDSNLEQLPQQPGQYEDNSTTIAPDTPASSYGSPDGHPKPYAQGMSQYDHYAWEQKNAVPGAAPQYGVHQLDAQTRPTEMYAPEPMYELPNQGYSHELVADPPRSGTAVSSELEQPQQQYQQQQQYQHQQHQQQQRYQAP
ncbi:hypothetical protein QBC38DRAFT_359191 [Podospora fimiseda]|uniref:Fucose-specific lectin n=1 Tax=Podospora fimiseda TaxID=252190 RepID=A0AAN7H1Y0_9PEZI|nr:hypothetical protein QBC38DRAFT_359191 [Podospora fimiseda]